MIINFFDLETTGLITPGGFPQIVQYAFVTWEDGKLTTCRQRFVMPTIPVEPGAAKCNGFSEAYWKEREATPLCQADLAVFYEMMQGKLVGGQNVIAFDLPIIQAECNRLGFAAPLHDYHVADTMAYGLVLQALGLVRGASLSKVAEFLDLKKDIPAFGYPDRHRPHDAVFDAACSAQLFSEMLVVTSEGFSKRGRNVNGCC